MKKIKILILVIFLSAFFLPFVEALEVGSIKGSYIYDNIPLKNSKVYLYKIAELKDLETNAKFIYLEKFNNLELNINSIKSSEWQNYANELTKHITINNIIYDLEMEPDDEGNYEFQNLSFGLYLIIYDEVETDTATYSSVPILISVPNYDEINKIYINDITIQNKIEEKIKEPKPEEITNVPQTSDDIMIYILISISAIIILIGLGVYIYKKKRR